MSCFSEALAPPIVLLLAGCIGASGDVTPQGQDQSRVVLAVPLDRPYTFRQPDSDQRLTSRGGFLHGQVVSVYDGNTITVLIDGRTETVRLIGIEVPTLDQVPGGAQARDVLRSLIDSKTVRLETDIAIRDQDKHLLAYVYSGDTLINLEMVRQGQAVIYTLPPNVAHVEDYRKAQQDAREAERGYGTRRSRSIAPDWSQKKARE